VDEFCLRDRKENVARGHPATACGGGLLEEADVSSVRGERNRDGEVVHVGNG